MRFINNSLTFPSSNELPFDTCSIPPLPLQRNFHSQSLLSGETMVVCGGRDDGFHDLDSCTSWVAGNTSWTHFYNMRYLTMVFIDAQLNLSPEPTVDYFQHVILSDSQGVILLIKITTTVWRDPIPPSGRRPLSPTPLCFWGAGAEV